MFLTQRRQKPTAMVNNHLQNEEDEQLHSDPKAPRFFRMILQDTLQHGELVFPNRFIRLYGGKLSNVVRLRVPTGDIWEMELQRCNGAVWLEKNSWASFASFYSIGFGHLLVFRIVEVGISEFEVLIFDKSTVEINYPMVNCSIKAEPSDSGFRQDHEPVIRSGKKFSRDHGELPLQLNPLKKRKISKASSSKVDKVQKRDHNKKKVHRLNSKEKEEALVRAASFRSMNPYFKMVMQPSYVNSRYTLCPFQFMQTYIPDNTSQLKLVCASNGKTWTARYCIYKAQHARMNQGWDTFATENQLVVGDVCVFELINGAEGEVSFKVTIFRAPQVANSKTVHDKVALTSQPVPRHPFFKKVIQYSSTSLMNIPASFTKRPLNKRKISEASSSKLDKVQKRDHNKMKMHRLNSKEKEEALVRAESFRSTNPYFKLVMQPSYVTSRYNLCPPIGFMKTYMPNNTGQLKLVCASNGKTWTIRYYICKARQARVIHGWDTFAKENQLVVGDICVFELINGGAEGEVSFKVTIFRAPRAAKSKILHDKVALTSQSVPRHPSFEKVIQYSSTSLLIVPANFARRHFNLERKEQMITLLVGDRSWQVKLLNNKNRWGIISSMSAGVSAFIKGNSLKVGELCIFELIDSKQMVFKVSISRNATVIE